MQDYALYNPEAERELLGLVMFDNSNLELIGYMKKEYFFEPIHQEIYQAIINLKGENMQANPITIAPQMPLWASSDNVLASTYLIKLVSSVSPISDISSLSRIIYREWQKRHLVKIAEQIREAVETENPEETATKIIGDLQTLGSTDKRRTVKTDYDIACEIMDDMKLDSKPYSTGLAKLDQCMDGGLYPSNLYGFGARKKVGKTLLAATLSYNLAQAGCKHIFLAGEMGSKQIHQRVMSRMMDVYPSAFRTDYRNTQDFYTRAATALQGHTRNALYQNVPNLTFSELRQYMATAVNRHKVKGIILDYWQLVGGYGKEGERKHLDDVAQFIAGFCKENEIWAVVFSQMNQDGNTRGSEGLRNACDQMYEIHREDLTTGEAWVEMKETRYTQWMNIGEANWPAWKIEDKGLYFREL